MDKILQYNTVSKNDIELSVKKKKEVEYHFEGTVKPKRGQVVFEINEETLDVIPASYKSNTISYSQNSIVTQKLIINPNCIYIPSINKQNAIKKYRKNKSQSFYYAKEPEFKLNDSFYPPPTNLSQVKQSYE